MPAKCGIIRHSCRKKHLNLQNQTMTVLQIHLPLTHPVPLGRSHIPLVMQRCSRNEYCAGRTTFWYPQQRNPFPETPNTKAYRCWDKSLNMFESFVKSPETKGSSWSDSSDEHDPPPPSALRGRSTGMTRRMSAFVTWTWILGFEREKCRANFLDFRPS